MEQGVAVLRLEGAEPSVMYRLDALAGLLEGGGRIVFLDDAESRALWREIRDVSLLPAATTLWRVSIPPAAAAELEAAMSMDGIELLFDWSGGLVWIALQEADDAMAGRIRGAIGEQGGHATLIRADAETRMRTTVFQPQAAALAGLTRRVKEAFDPQRVLNPGRMYEGV